ncbi:MAG TPA: alpha/beta fold hydrolase [Chloroflexota bacterium]|nr:alpha/beta fold hydrolase [Chloroflexota bacterium]
MKGVTLVAVLLAFGAAACGPGAAPGVKSEAQARVDASPTAVVLPTAGLPTTTPIRPTATVAPPTPIPSPTATLHPLTIAAARSRDYPGSELVTEQTLAPGVNYDRSIVSYKSDGLKQYALLTIPRGQRPATGWPVVVFNHGFIQPQQYRTTERYIAYTDAFSRNGYMLIRPDYRGHGSSEGRASGGYGNDDYVTDVLNAFSTIRRHPDADPSRVGMWGHSMGGYITLRAMVLNPEIRAGVIWGGVVGSYPDLIYNWRSPPPTVVATPAQTTGTGAQGSWRNVLLRDFGTPEHNPGFWASISANTYVSDLPGPIQLHHGGADTSVPTSMSVTLDRQIREVGGSTELFVYPGDDHDISRNFGVAMNRSVAFMDANVKRRAI